MKQQTHDGGSIRQAWQDYLHERWHTQLADRLSPVELSALYSCIPDCLDSFQQVYTDLLPNLFRCPSQDYGSQHDVLSDIGGVAGSLEHVRNHIMAARRGFDVLLGVLADKADRGDETR